MYVCHESKPPTKIIPNICVLSCAKLFLEESYFIAFDLWVFKCHGHDSGRHRQTQKLIPHICVPSCDDLFVDSRLIAFLLCGFQQLWHDDVEGTPKAQKSIPNICVQPCDVSEKTPTWLCSGGQVSSIIDMISRNDISKMQKLIPTICVLSRDVFWKIPY